jgi:predicted O-linked N-acetylglucosamine transferase (SPINDLY family)
MPTIADTFAAARQQHAAGNLARAKQLYRDVVASDPLHADAWNALARLEFEQGKPADAEATLRRALQALPRHAGTHNNLGNVLASQAKVNEAADCFRQAVRLDPAMPEAHNNLGNAFRIQGRPEQAIAHFREAIRLKANYAEAHHNLAIALLRLDRAEQAIGSSRQALRWQPNNAEALATLTKALERCPIPEGYNTLGNTLAQAGRHEDAAAAYRQALCLNPSLAEAHSNLGIVLCKLGRLDDGVASFQEALRLKPDYPDALNNLGNALKDQGRLDEVLTVMERARRSKPGDATLHSNVLGTLNYHPGYDAPAIFEAHRCWEEQHARFPVPSAFANDPSAERRLRIGYVSPDFSSHVVGRNLWPLMRHHDHEQFHITLYANMTHGDPMTTQFQQCADRWCPIALWSDEQVADRIRHDGIDVLVDLALHTQGNRLLVFARKPAPVQATFAGYPGTTGLHAIDYRLTDPYLDPPGWNDAYYTEASYRLPHTFWCFDPQTEEPAVAPLPALEKGIVTFGCLNNFCKVNDGVLELWAQVLRTIPKSRLLLLAKDGCHRLRAFDFLAAKGVAAERVEFCSPRPRADYLALYHQVDIGLDTLPYNGHSTSLDSYWMGVPVVTLVGQTVVGRAGLSQLTNFGLTELAAASAEQFVGIAVELADNRPRLAALRAGLRERMRQSPLMDAVGFTRGIETAYRHMWRNWCGHGTRT